MDNYTLADLVEENQPLYKLLWWSDENLHQR